MRLVFVNHCHPDAPHVCAARLRDFAQACARAGHQVVLLTESLPDQGPSHSPAALPAALRGHDWRRPFHLAVAPKGGRRLAALRQGRAPALLRRPLLAAAYLFRSGLFCDWQGGAAPYLPVLADHFRPETCWATFGNTDAWIIARRLARSANAAWVADVKDPWGVFIPAPFRRLLARRFSDMRAMTALSDQHAAEAQAFFHRRPVAVYSGIDAGFLPPPPAPPADGPVLLLGGLYAQENLESVVAGITAWNPTAQVIYAGAEIGRVRRAFAASAVRLDTPGYVDLNELRALSQKSVASIYVRNPRALYQHKVIELLALDRPVLCLPDEAPESLEIAARLGAEFRSCADFRALARALAETVGRHRPIDRAVLADYTWDAQARILMRALS